MRVWIAFIALVLIILAINFSSAIFATCPNNIYGSNNKTYIKYFSSPLCIACWAQKPIIEKVAKEQGDAFLLEEYSVDFCREAAQPYVIRGVPAFLIKDKIIYGLQSEEALREIIK